MTLFDCVTTVYIGGTPQQVWRALTDGDESAAWWAHRNVSTWTAGDPWSHERIDGSGIADISGIVLAAHPPTQLDVTWANPSDGTSVAGLDTSGPRAPSRMRLDLTPTPRSPVSPSHTPGCRVPPSATR